MFSERKIIVSGILFSLILISGCSFTGGPRPRIGYLPTATSGILFPDPEKLGKHAYGFNFFSEVGGITYTCRGGHIDLDHLRGNADDARFIVKRTRSTLAAKRKGFSYNITGETSTHKITFTYPENWDKQPDKEKIIDEVAYEAGTYLAFSSTTWHEILTWFGVSFALIDYEFNSAFSWEDNYSNLVGARLGVQAMQDKEHSFDEAMTIAIYDELKKLGVQSKKIAYEASDKMRGQWYTGNGRPKMKMRNFDIGLDGFVSPQLIAGVADCDDDPLILPAPTTEKLQSYGFTMTHQIYPNVLQQGKIFKAAGSKKIFPEIHYPILIEYMKKGCIEKGYQYVE